MTPDPATLLSRLDGDACLLVDSGRWSIMQRTYVADHPVETNRGTGTSLSEALQALGSVQASPCGHAAQVTVVECSEDPVADSRVAQPGFSLTPMRPCTCSGHCGACQGTGMVPELVVITVIDPAGEVCSSWGDPRQWPVTMCTTHPHCQIVLPAEPVLRLISSTVWGPHNSVAITGSEAGWDGLLVGQHVSTAHGDAGQLVDQVVRCTLGGYDRDGDWAGGPWGGVGVDDAGRVVSLTVSLVARTDAHEAITRASHEHPYALVPEMFGDATYWTLYRQVDGWTEVGSGWDIDDVLHLALAGGLI